MAERTCSARVTRDSQSAAKIMYLYGNDLTTLSCHAVGSLYIVELRRRQRCRASRQTFVERTGTPTNCQPLTSSFIQLVGMSGPYVVYAATETTDQRIGRPHACTGTLIAREGRRSFLGSIISHLPNGRHPLSSIIRGGTCTTYCTSTT